MEGLTDTMVPVFLPIMPVVMGGVVVGSIHSVLLAANTHCDMFVPLDKVQLMNMKPTDIQTDQL